VQEGDVILFPSTLLHYVNPSPANKVTISYNIGCIF
jgi:predicted 2-oxoglutarate/Fe(II)-dependent dioxygenase YbiX